MAVAAAGQAKPGQRHPRVAEEASRFLGRSACLGGTRGIFSAEFRQREKLALEKNYFK